MRANPPKVDADISLVLKALFELRVRTFGGLSYSASLSN
jgi:hypothetical protein